MRAVRRRTRFALSLRPLPRNVALFVWRADRHARRTGDGFSKASAARPAALVEILELAHGATAVVELGTGTGWTAIALALDEPSRRVITYDPVAREERERYLDLAGADVRARIEFRNEPDATGPRAGDVPVDALFVDSEHERQPVHDAFVAWRDALAPGATVIFHDFDHPHYPGVRTAIVDDLGLQGDDGRAKLLISVCGSDRPQARIEHRR